MIYLRHMLSLLKHKWWVLVAGVNLGVPLWRLLVHDWHKFLPAEFGPYARHWHLRGEGAERPHDPGFTYAWLHHENHGAHHWGYWIPRSGKKAFLPLPMPETYVREMVADWLGASRVYTGSWDMTDWLARNLDRMTLHPLTRARVDAVLVELGYRYAQERLPFYDG
jgi:hypothetical protein